MSPPDTPPTQEKLRVLNLEDNASDSELIRAELEAEWKEVELLRVETREAFVRALEEFEPDIALCDFSLPNFDGGSALALVRQTHPDIPVIMVTGVLSDSAAVRLIKMGARDYVTKDRLQRLASAVQGALSLEQGIRARKVAEKVLRQSESDFRTLVEHSPIAMLVDVGVDTDEKIIMMNRKFTDLFGYTMEDMPDIQHWWRLAYPDEEYREQLRAIWIAQAGKAIREHSDIEPREVRVTCKDGSIRHVRISLSSAGNRNIITFEDFTARKRAEEDLARFFDLIPDLVCIATTDGYFLKINPAWQELLGYTMQEILAMPFLDLIHPDDRAATVQEVERQLAGGKTVQFSNRYRCRDGGYRWLEWRASPAIGEKLLFASARDITERKQAEADIRRLEQLYAALSRCNQAIVRSKNETDLFAQVCRIAVQYGSFKMAWIGLIDPNTRMLIPASSSGEGAEEYLRDIKISADACSEYGQGPTAKALCENRPFWCQDFLNSTLTAPWRERGAALGWRSSAALPLHRDGVVIGAFSLYAGEANAFGKNERDLLIEMAEDLGYALENLSREAVRKQAEESLRKLSLAVEQSPNSIAITDLDAKLEYINEGFVRASGYSRAELIGQNPRILQSGKTPRETYDDMWTHLTRGEAWKGEFINRRRDGREYIESTFVSPVRDAGGHVTHYIGIKEDITERKRLEKQLMAQYEQAATTNARLVEANEQLEHANAELKSTQQQLLQSEKMASIGLLAAGVAHEINNPVGYINSNLGTLEKYLADILAVVNEYEKAALTCAHPGLQEVQALKEKLDFGFLRDDIQSLLAESREGLERIKEIVLGLKDFSRSSADETWRWADLAKCLENTLAIVRNELKYKCEVVREFGVLPQVYCLPSQLEQVFMNLLVNAVQAIETHGTITLRTGQEGDRVWVEISDTGAGIPPDILPRIFDPFFTTKPVGTGTGLGLPVSYGIMERHHGKIEVHSEVGKGSTFRVTLPVQPDNHKEET
ncbi:PAS domain S-box protein [Candidatus Ferrigenium straubiae]|jgi:PAS domain S-box-containing protein|uniref:PAS domain S-box protein n=1 Tax=Candidatus Ferrigenium straubiae TaxID=2919506 RepID=UPI003F4A87E3